MSPTLAANCPSDRLCCSAVLLSSLPTQARHRRAAARQSSPAVERSCSAAGIEFSTTATSTPSIKKRKLAQRVYDRDDQVRHALCLASLTATAFRPPAALSFCQFPLPSKTLACESESAGAVS